MGANPTGASGGKPHIAAGFGWRGSWEPDGAISWEVKLLLVALPFGLCLFCSWRWKEWEGDETAGLAAVTGTVGIALGARRDRVALVLLF